jgi:hypothetical protein
MLELPDDKVRADDAARVRDYLFSHGPALPQKVASDCGVSISFVLRLIRQGTLMELRPQEPGTCEVCDAQNIVGTLCPACRLKLTPPAEDEVPLPRPAPRAEPASRDATRPGFHSRRLNT